MRRTTVAALGALFVLSAGGGLGAFADAGHRVIGRIAELHLQESRAQKEVRRILRPGESLADAAVWMDVIRNPLYEDGDTAPFRLEHPANDTYHYANLPFQADRYEPAVPGARRGDIVQTMRDAIAVLRGQSNVFTEREALRVLAHLVGDIHQPLHVATGFVTASQPLLFVVPKGSTGWRVTLGGNALVYGPEDRYNLHSYWDAHAVNLAMGKQEVETYGARLFKELPAPAAWKADGVVESWPEQWAAEALALGKEVHAGIELTAYLGPDDAKRVAHRWRIRQPAGYDDLARRHIPLQLAKGGYRLAATLRAIWPE